MSKTTAVARQSAIPVLAPTDLDELYRYGKLASQSGFFNDVREAAQAAVKIAVGQEMGIAPFQAMTSIHVIKGRISLSANLMAAMLRRAGYRYKVAWFEDKAVEITFFDPDKQELGVSSFSMRDAEQAGLLGSANWKKYTRNMLWARAMMNGIRWYTPEIAIGIYDPDELGSEVNAEGELVQPTQAQPQPIQRQRDRRPRLEHKMPSDPLQPEVVEVVEVEVVSEAEAAEAFDFSMDADWHSAHKGLCASLKEANIDRETGLKPALGVTTMKAYSPDQLRHFARGAGRVGVARLAFLDAESEARLIELWKEAQTEDFEPWQMNLLTQAAKTRKAELQMDEVAAA